MLLEHGGSEHPATEAQLSAQLHEEQEAWLKKAREAECPILKNARETLAQSGFDGSRVDMKFGHEGDVDGTILEEARLGQHETIGVGRSGTSRMRRIFGGGVPDRLLQDAKSLAIWIIE